MDILFEDNHLLVVNKPTGILTEPSGTRQTNLEDQCKQYLKEKYGKPGNVFLTATHRLDKPASGIVVFAKTSKALSRLQADNREKVKRKNYLTVVEGEPEVEEQDLEDYLFHDDFYSRVVHKNHPKAKLARLHYSKIKTEGTLSLLRITLETGRYHQIRNQLSHRGWPIVGDIRYGSHIEMHGEQIALHHTQMEIVHPVTQEVKVFESLPCRNEIWNKFLL